MSIVHKQDNIFIDKHVLSQTVLEWLGVYEGQNLKRNY